MKVLYLLILFFAVVGLLGGIGYTFYLGYPLISIFLLATGYVAWPGITILFKKLTD